MIFQGFMPALDCKDSGALNQVEWYFNLKGSVIDGTFVLIGKYTSMLLS